ncbi:MAG: oligosaccharide flippase family protein [Pseudomonadota bacterium]|nr:oligosaccharide flippase family protein [Pseudomonadota bacterium]
MNNFNLRKNVKFSVVSFFINIALIFISYRLIIEVGGLELVGLWATMMAWISLVRLGDVGMSNATLRFVALENIENSDGRLAIGKIIDTALLLNSIFFILLCVLAYFLINLFMIDTIEETYRGLADKLLPLMLGIFFSINISSVLFGCIQGMHYGYVSSKISVMTTSIQLILVIILVPKYELHGFAIAQIFQYLSAIIISWIFINKKLHRKIQIPIYFDFESLKKMLRFSAKAQAANIINGSFEPLSKILINKFSGLEIQGIYELAYKTVSMSRNAITAGVMASLPTITTLLGKDPGEGKILYKKIKMKLRLAAFSLILLLIISSPLISYLWIGSFNSLYCTFIIIIGCGFFFNTIGAPAYNLGTASAKMKYNIIINLLVITLLILLTLALNLMTSTYSVVTSVGISLAFGGILIRYMNEKYIIGNIS